MQREYRPMVDCPARRTLPTDQHRLPAPIHLLRLAVDFWARIISNPQRREAGERRLSQPQDPGHAIGKNGRTAFPGIAQRAAPAKRHPGGAPQIANGFHRLANPVFQSRNATGHPTQSDDPGSPRRRSCPDPGSPRGKQAAPRRTLQTIGGKPQSNEPALPVSTRNHRARLLRAPETHLRPHVFRRHRPKRKRNRIPTRLPVPPTFLPLVPPARRHLPHATAQSPRPDDLSRRRDKNHSRKAEVTR